VLVEFGSQTVLEIEQATSFRLTFKTGTYVKDRNLEDDPDLVTDVTIEVT